MGKTLVKRAYKYRLYPTEQQAQVLLRTFGCVRPVYNKTLEAPVEQNLLGLRAAARHAAA